MVKILKNLLIAFLTIVMLGGIVSAESFTTSANGTTNITSSNSVSTTSATTTTNVEVEHNTTVTSNNSNRRLISPEYNSKNRSKNRSEVIRERINMYKNMNNHRLGSVRNHVVYTNRKFFNRREQIQERINELKRDDVKLLIKEMRNEKNRARVFELRKMVLMRELNRAKILASIYETKIENSNFTNKGELMQGLEAVNIRINDYIKEINESKNVSQLREIQKNLRNDFKTIKKEIIFAHVLANINGYNRAIVKLQNVIALLNKTGIQTVDLNTQLQNIESEYNTYKVNVLNGIKNSSNNLGLTLKEYRADREKIVIICHLLKTVM